MATDLSDYFGRFQKISNDPLYPLKYFYGSENYNNYRMHKFIANSNFPIYSTLSGFYVGRMEDEEKLRWNRDFAKNTGVDIDNWKYPISLGYYGNVSSYSRAVSGAIRPFMKLYKFSGYRKYKRRY